MSVIMDSDYSKMTLTDQNRTAEVFSSDDRRTIQVGKARPAMKQVAVGSNAFHFRRKTERISPRTSQISQLSKNAITIQTTRSFKKTPIVSLGEPGTLFYLGKNGGSDAL